MSQHSQLPFAFITPGELIAAAIVLPAVSMVLVIMRFVTRRVSKQAVGIEDWMSLVAMVSYGCLHKSERVD